MASVAAVDSVPSSSPSLLLPLSLSTRPCRTENSTCIGLPPGSNTPLNSSLVLEKAIPSLLVAFYAILVTLWIWRSWSFPTLKRWARCFWRRLTHHKRNQGYVHISDNEEYDLENYTVLEQLEPTTSSDPSVTLFDADEQLARKQGDGDGDGDNGVGNSIDLSQYFNPETGRLKDSISNPRETKVDRMCAADQMECQAGSWSGRAERMLDKMVLRMQNWLEGGGWKVSEAVSPATGRSGNGRLRNKSVKGPGNGEECGEIRRMLLKYAEEEEDEDEFELHQLRFGGSLSSETGPSSPLQTPKERWSQPCPPPTHEI